jgi:hypothetical protein
MGENMNRYILLHIFNSVFWVSAITGLVVLLRKRRQKRAKKDK